IKFQSTRMQRNGDQEAAKVEEKGIDIGPPKPKPSLTRRWVTVCILLRPSHLATGMRRGELLALQWCDIDLDRATLRVERSVEETRRGLRVKPPKTKRGRRNIA
ncbi:MAG: site-specific integrase, partial [Methyloceanibacter sp.]